MLDAKRPGWAQRIDTGTLDLELDWRCVLGQLYGSYCHAVRREFGWNTYDDYMPEDAPQAQHGFTVSGLWVDGGDPRWNLLQDAWIEAIADRLVPTVDEGKSVDARLTPVEQG